MDLVPKCKIAHVEKLDEYYKNFAEHDIIIMDCKSNYDYSISIKYLQYFGDIEG